jgi:hypothetical protein
MYINDPYISNQLDEILDKYANDELFESVD